MNLRLLTLATVLLCLHVNAQIITNTFHLVKDIDTAKNSNPENFNYSAYGHQQFAVSNNISYFNADDGVHGAELWKSDGTPTGTRLVKDINAGPLSSHPENIVTSNGKIIFTVTTKINGTEIWVSDGTAAGTKLLKDILSNSVSNYTANLCDVNGTVFFIITDNNYNEQLWKTDGTSNGTIIVTDLTASGYRNVGQLVSASGLLFFTAVRAQYSHRCLWRSDGTTAGTYMIKDGNFQYSGIHHLTAYKNKLYFTATETNNVSYLWESDGTFNGTHYANGYNAFQFKEDYGSIPDPFVVNNGYLYFSAYTAASGTELYRYNENNGISLVKDINADGTNTYVYNRIVSLNNTIYFAFEVSGVFQLWKTKGISSNTVMVADLENVTDVGYFYTDSTHLYFSAFTPEYGYEPWCSDGSKSNTLLLKNIATGNTSSRPFYFTSCNGKVLFSATSLPAGTELWQTDGTKTHTTILKNINTTATANAFPNAFTSVGDGNVLFAASAQTSGSELYISDGTEAGTKPVKDIVPGENGSYPSRFQRKNNYTYFVANDSSGLSGIFKTDGTAANTIELAQTPYQYGLSYNFCITNDGSLYYFLVNPSNYLYELWKVGTNTTPVLLKANLIYTPGTLTAMGNKVYFAAAESGQLYGSELWLSNGTISGTSMVKDIYPGNTGSAPHSFFVFKGNLYFGADSGGIKSLWKTNGTSNGTIQLKEVTPNNFLAIGSKLYFGGYTEMYGTELWVTDGTPLGTNLIKDIYPGQAGSNPYYFTNLNGSLFFVANDGIHGTELWKTTGKAVNTSLVKDITLGSGGSFDNYNDMTVANSKLFFIDRSATGETTLWISDGTDAGTHEIHDDGLTGLDLLEILGDSTNLYLSASNEKYGSELYVGDATAFSNLKKIGTSINAFVYSLSAKLATNPFNNKLTIAISSSVEQKVNVIVTDASGDVYYNHIVNVPAGTTTCNITAGGWTNGLYIIKLTGVQTRTNTVHLEALK